ncbi:uncharacterized protein LOC123310753 [Coccinella septempunctata]|uniref:uncharacterized protein LOC123310753 n=1 Tax=Coccinella septempunctata TaxID=41139 RepID=UPI001D05DB78|nr:uncharacterized protein LOC123310753 [Coccinella septempunctata]
MAYTTNLLICTTLLLIFSIATSADDDAPTVETQEGFVRGTYLISRNGRLFDVFRGIPYAQPPVGDLRFKAPQPVDKWDGIRDATKEGPVCIQKNYLFANPGVEGVEDCLYLNVYVPRVSDKSKLLPVMVSIHWGGYFAGRGNKDFFGPEKIMDKDVVLVTFNYRLGVMGLFSTLDDEAPGNNALKDQVALLRWIQRNIKCFGGDPDKVTLFGNSAGASSAHLHMVSPLSKGLFHRAISQSGSGLALWSTPLNELHKQIGPLQGLYFQCNTSTSKNLVECLRKIDAKDLVKSGDAFKYFSVDPLSIYTVVTENQTERNPEPFMTKLPKDSILEGNFYSVPWIIGTVQNEGNLRASALIRQSFTRRTLNKLFADLMVKEMYYSVSVPPSETRELYKKAQKLYMGGEEFVNITNPRNIQGFIDLWSDRSMKYPFYQSVMLHAGVGSKPIWAYSFEYRGRQSYEDIWAATNETIDFDWGVTHCDDLLYLFNSPALFPKNDDPIDKEMSEILLDRWTNFATNGNPQRSSLKNYWPSVNFTGLNNMKNDNLYILNITGSSTGGQIMETVQKGFFKERMHFWASEKLWENFEGLENFPIKRKMIWSLLLLYLHVSTSSSCRTDMDPTTITTNGRVVGINMLSRKGRTFSAYRGIPYAKPPVGPLRFKEPREPEKWNHTLFATEDAPKCAQKNYLFGNQMVEGSEDCLYINVYTPVLDLHKSPKKLLPVMVFIHWGGFFTGTARSDYLGPEYLMDKDVVLVTFNYRLGVLGFFSTYDDASPGNFGLKDQNLALRWVKKNIKHFGGSSRKVTLFGQSAGGASVHYHMLSKSSRNLFQRAISESGTALALWAQPVPGLGKELSQIQAKLVGCGETIGNSSDLVDCLRRVPVEILLKSGDQFKFFSVDPLSIYQPVVETETRRNTNPFLTKPPLNYINDGDFMKIPWIVGLASDDGLIRSSALWFHEDLRNKLISRFDELMPKLMALNLSVMKDKIELVWKQIKEFYFTSKEGRTDTQNNIIRGLTDLYSDRSFHYSTYQSTLLHSKKGHKPIWFFNFAYRGEHSYESVFSGVNHTNCSYRASHCDDLLYLFRSNAFFPNLTNGNDQRMIDKMVEMWTNFATYSHPTPPNNRRNIEWHPISNWKEPSEYEIMKNITYLDINGIYTNESSLSFRMKTGVFNDRLQFWEQLPLFENIRVLDQNHQDL